MKSDPPKEVLAATALDKPLHSCPVCERADMLRLLCAVDGHDVYTCGVCAADHVFPVPDQRALKKYYDRAEWFDGGETGGYSDYDTQTEWSVGLVESVLQAFGDQPGLSVLDVGCGYGVHLAMAAKRGWKCFGVELSDHARAVALERLEGSSSLVESVSDLIPHEFDLVLILDTIEHLSSPYPTLFHLFAIGAITPKTRVVITTPNAGSSDARSDPAGWAFRHPPSHLTYYSAESLKTLLRRLHFKEISITGLHGPEYEASLSECSGLLVEATGCDFTEFMRERYVPGTWSKVAEYEHIPRYVLASQLAENKQVLDFGCGTGYGSAMLAESAASVVGLDIDAAALDWARESHRAAGLSFYQSDDLGASLEASSIDLVTCFEMIEHVDYTTQQAVIASIGRLLREDGLLVISTPNPEVTKLYGENPYHIREMTEAEFLELLNVEFPHSRIYRQLVRSSVAFGSNEALSRFQTAPMHQANRSSTVAPMAFVALCSQKPLPDVMDLVVFDDNTDLIHDYLETTNKLNQALLSAYQLQEKVLKLELNSAALTAKADALRIQDEEVHRLTGALTAKDDALRIQDEEVHRLTGALTAKDDALRIQDEEVHRLTGALTAKDDALRIQDEEVHRLTGALTAKDDALRIQDEEVHRLTGALTAKDDALRIQDEEVHRLTGALTAKDDALRIQDEEVHRLTGALTAKDDALRIQDEEVHRLTGALTAKDDALRIQGEEVHRLTGALTAKDDALRIQDEEVHRLTGALTAKDDALRIQDEEVHRLTGALTAKDEALRIQGEEVHRLTGALTAKDDALRIQNEEADRLNTALVAKEEALAQRDAELSALQRTKLFRLREAVLNHPFSMRKVLHIAYLLAALVTPRRLRTLAGPWLVRIRSRAASLPPVNSGSTAESTTARHRARQKNAKKADALKVAHVIANFMTGGSSQLVVDIIEYLGDSYRHSIITSFIPKPPAYVGLTIEECRFPTNAAPFIEYFQRTRPDFVHVHYWGDCDEPWYAKAIEAAEELGLPVIENVNTPVSPYLSSAIFRYVYVSDYVRRVFGENDSRHITIYPGSDFSHFKRDPADTVVDDCVGMVYRLERDKLNEKSIEPLITIALRRPQTRILIVGGGSLLKTFRDRVAAVGVGDSFDFTDYVSYDDLPDLYRRMTLFVAPVWKESFGQVSSFAMNMEVPVIGYDVGAIPEIVGARELLAPAGDSEKLADVAIELLDNPKLRVRVGREQRERAQARYSVQAMAQVYARIYAELGSK